MQWGVPLLLATVLFLGTEILVQGSIVCEGTECQLQSSRWVVFSSDAQPFYLFFAPITTLLWSVNIGYTPIVVIVVPTGYTREDTSVPRPQGWKILDLVLARTEEAGGKVGLLYNNKGKDGIIKDGTVSQLSRLYAAALNLSAEDYILTSDVDMFPLSKDHFHQQDFSPLPVHLFYANAYSHVFAKDGTVMYPLCYIGMKAATWKEVMGIPTETRDDGKDVERMQGMVLAAIEDGIARYGKDRWQDSRKQDGDIQWYFDQVLFGEMISKWWGHPQECLKIPRYPFRDRLDRSRWTFTGLREELNGKIDSHVLRPGHIEQNWPKLVQLLAVLLPEDKVAWLQSYRAEFMQILAQ